MNLYELKGVHVFWFHIIYVYIYIYINISYPLSSVDRSFSASVIDDWHLRSERYPLRSQGLVEGKEELKADARHLKLKQENRN